MLMGKFNRHTRDHWADGDRDPPGHGDDDACAKRLAAGAFRDDGEGPGRFVNK